MVLRRQVQIQPDGCRSLAPVPGNREQVHVIRHGFGILLLCVVSGPVDGDEFTPGKQAFQTENHQPPVLVEGFHSFGLAAFPFSGQTTGGGGAAVVILARNPAVFRFRNRIQPQENRPGIMACRGQPADTARMNEGLADGFFPGGLRLRQIPGPRTPLQDMADQLLVLCLQAGPACQNRFCHGLVGGEPFVMPGWRAGRQCRQPQIQGPVQLPVRKQGDPLRKAQTVRIAPGQFETAVGSGDPVQQASAHPEVAGLGTDPRCRAGSPPRARNRSPSVRACSRRVTAWSG